jgi:hypothetical protein
MKIESSRQIFETYSNVKFHEIPFGGSRIIPSDGRMYRQTDMAKLIVAFRNFSKARKDEGRRVFNKVSVEITVHFI